MRLDEIHGIEYLICEISDVSYRFFNRAIDGDLLGQGFKNRPEECVLVGGLIAILEENDPGRLR